jgi:uncharacterized protein YlxW (UPF0749 family)
MDNQPAAAAPHTLHLPVLLLTIAFFGISVFQTVEVVLERDRIATARQSQEQPLQEGAKLRQQLTNLSTRVAQLAESGNANAKAIVEQLRREGVTIKTGP